MAAFTKNGTSWRAQIYVAGCRESGTFSTKAKAQAWAAMRETELRAQKSTGVLSGKTCRDAFERYENEVSINKRGHRWESLRLRAMTSHFGDKKLAELTSDAIGKWRDERLKSVTGSTVNRDLNLLSHVLNTARKEWKWISHSPTKDVRRPKDSPPRDRRITDDEIKAICFSLGFSESPIKTKNQSVAVAFLFAIETAMRAGEICALRPEWIIGSVAYLPASINKNGVKRNVPLSSRAIKLLSLLPQDRFFDITTASLDALFRAAKKRACIEGLTFHDTRHEAITRLARKLNVLDLARMVGHRDLRMLQVYYNESAADIAQRLD